MSTPRLGFGWNEVAFSGSSRPPAQCGAPGRSPGPASARRRPAVRSRRERVVDRVVVADALRRRAQRGQQVVVERPRRRPGPRAGAGSMVAQPSPSVATRVSGARARDGLGCATGAHAAPTVGGRGEVVEAEVRPAPGGWRPRNSGVSSWSTSIARPRSCGAAGCAALQPQVGGVPVVAVGDQGPACGQRRRRARRAPAGRGSPRPGAAARPGRRSRRSGAAASDRVHERRGSAEAPRCTSRIGCRVELPSRSSGRRARRPATGWMPSCGSDGAVLGRAAARCEMSSAPTRPRTVRPAAVYSCR